MTRASRFLLSARDVEQALGTGAAADSAREHGAVQAIGSIVAAAARDAAYRSFNARIPVDDVYRPVAVGEMALLFDNLGTAENTFAQVAGAAHLRAKVGECKVAVETVTAVSGLVSYWAFLQLGPSIVVLTLDTMDPQEVSMTNFRALVTRCSELLEA
ncbi:MAG: hypothetical protein ACR2GA_03835 [Chloroflexota bacterium]